MKLNCLILLLLVVIYGSLMSCSRSRTDQAAGNNKPSATPEPAATAAPRRTTDDRMREMLASLESPMMELDTGTDTSSLPLEEVAADPAMSQKAVTAIKNGGLTKIFVDGIAYEMPADSSADAFVVHGESTGSDWTWEAGQVDGDLGAFIDAGFMDDWVKDGQLKVVGEFPDFSALIDFAIRDGKACAEVQRSFKLSDAKMVVNYNYAFAVRKDNKWLCLCLKERPQIKK